MEDLLQINKKTTYTEYPTRLLYLPRGIGRLEKLGVRKSYPKDYVIAKVDKIVDHCFIVKKGRVIGFEYTRTGEERVYNFMEVGSILLEANLLLNKPPHVSFKTVMPTDLICIERETLLNAMAKDQNLTLDIIESISNKFLSSMDQIRQSCCHNVEWKICDLLLIFADRFGVQYDGKVLITEKLSQQMISNLLGINRVTAVRSIKQLKEMDLIEQINGLYCIRNIEKLKNHQEKLDELMKK